jgi:prepilin-type processing-associated H-X9-DG protein
MMGRGPGARPLNNVLYKGGFYNAQNAPGPNQINWARDMAPELPEFHCPADYGYTGTHLPDWRDSKLTSYDHYGNSYAANTWWIAKRGPECELMSNSPFLHPLSTIPSPKRTFMYIENCGRFADLYNLGADGCQTRSELTDEPIRGWHGEPFTFNTAFVDGHASRLFIKGHLQPQLRIGRYPLCEDYDPDICYQVWHCGIVRGSTWQKDTLPTPPVVTGIGCNYAVVSALVW